MEETKTVKILLAPPSMDHLIGETGKIIKKSYNPHGVPSCRYVYWIEFDVPAYQEGKEPLGCDYPNRSYFFNGEVEEL